MDPSHIDIQKLHLLEERMRNNKPALKPPKTLDLKPSTTSDCGENGVMSTEPTKASQHDEPMSVVRQRNHSNSNFGDNEKIQEERAKEITSPSLNLESSEKIDDIRSKEALQEVKSGSSDAELSGDISYHSTGQHASKSLRKRKHDKMNIINESECGKLEFSLKKTKMSENDGIGRDSKGTPENLGDSETIFQKENLGLSGTKKITEFFKPRDLVEVVDKSAVRMTGIKPKRVMVEKKRQTTEVKEIVVTEDSKGLYTRIKDLEDKLETNKKEREKEQVMSENELKAYQDRYNNYKTKVQKLMAKNMLDIENFKRNERKALLNRQRQRLGEYVTQREGSKFTDVWSDGLEMRSVKEKLEATIREREELEKQKKTVKTKKAPTTATKPNVHHTENHTSVAVSVLGGSAENPDLNSNSNQDVKEAKERISAKIVMLQREENFLKEQLEKLEAEKVIFYQQYKKQYEEDHSRYGRPNLDTNAPAWPPLSERYQLLSLLGKGGFSEVYKAYDLDELCMVACKVHQLNPNWTENAKSNYVKHANREFEVHKELNHPNIVRLFDCINIDDLSFSTILEYCEGPDLSLYLKQHKILPEKDAKIIIKQILAGLKYLNDHKTKIIHYDLKPQNVMFHKGEVKISDFGLCKIVDPDVSRIELTSQGVGTYWYLPPECFMMEDQPPLINNKVDIWSVGVMLFEMLFGMRPFGHNMSQEKILKEKVILKSYNVSFPLKPAVSSEIKDFIKKCLAYNQDDRIDIHEAYELLYKK